jgi:hypothetical protein
LSPRARLTLEGLRLAAPGLGLIFRPLHRRIHERGRARLCPPPAVPGHGQDDVAFPADAGLDAAPLGPVLPLGEVAAVRVEPNVQPAGQSCAYGRLQVERIAPVAGNEVTNPMLAVLLVEIDDGNAQLQRAADLPIVPLRPKLVDDYGIARRILETVLNQAALESSLAALHGKISKEYGGWLGIPPE